MVVRTLWNGGPNREIDSKLCIVTKTRGAHFPVLRWKFDLTGIYYCFSIFLEMTVRTLKVTQNASFLRRYAALVFQFWHENSISGIYYCFSWTSFFFRNGGPKEYFIWWNVFYMMIKKFYMNGTYMMNILQIFLDPLRIVNFLFFSRRNFNIFCII